MPEVLALQCLLHSLGSKLPRLELPILPRVGTALPFALPILASGHLIVQRLRARVDVALLQCCNTFLQALHPKLP
jgi:hypothetical protein